MEETEGYRDKMLNEMKKKEATRIEWLDNAKGIGIILVVIGHSLITKIKSDYFIADWAFRYIYSFHMAFFLFISGVIFSNAKERYFTYNTLDYLKKKFRSLLVPYFSYSLIIFFLFYVLKLVGGGKLTSILSGSPLACEHPIELLSYMIIGINEQCNHLWYIYALFMLEVVSYLVEKNHKYGNICMLFLFACLYGIKTAQNIGVIYEYPILKSELFYNLMNNGLFFCIGSCAGKNAVEKITKNKVIDVVFIFALFIENFLIGVNSDNCVPLLYVAFRMILVVNKSIIIFGLCRFCIEYIKKNSVVGFIGNNSMAIYMIHQPIMCTCLGILLYQFLKLPVYMAMFVMIVISINLPVLIAWVMGKNNILKKTRSIILGR